MHNYSISGMRKQPHKYFKINMSELAGYTLHSWSLVIPLITGRDLAPEWTEQESPLQTFLGQLTCEITLLHMDL